MLGVLLFMVHILMLLFNLMIFIIKFIFAKFYFNYQSIMFRFITYLIVITVLNSIKDSKCWFLKINYRSLIVFIEIPFSHESVLIMYLFLNILIYPLTIFKSTPLNYLTYLKCHCNHYIIHPFQPFFKFDLTLTFY
jgi:hypothetical protein